MSIHSLDEIDIGILQILQKDSSITNLELAKRVGISPPPCLRRVNRLEKEGYIKGYHAQLDSKKLGYNVTIMLFVGLVNQSEKTIKEFKNKVQSWFFVRDCYMITGEYDAILRVVAKDWEHYNSDLVHQVTSFKSVVKINSSICVLPVKNDIGLPI